MTSRNLKMAGSALVLAAMSTGLLACSGGPTETAQKHDAYDGKTLLQGLMFGSGPAAAALPEIWGADAVARMDKSVATATPEQLAQTIDTAAARARSEGDLDLAARLAAQSDGLRKGTVTVSTGNESKEERIQLITAQIDAKHPGFFNGLAADLQSGNQARVDRALHGMTTELRGLLPVGGDPVDNGTGDGLYGYRAKVQIYTTIYAAAAFVVVGAFFLVGGWIFAAPEGNSAAPVWLTAPKDSSDLNYQVLVDRLTSRLAL